MYSRDELGAVMYIALPAHADFTSEIDADGAFQTFL